MTAPRSPKQALLEQVHRLAGTSPSAALTSSRHWKLVVNTMFRVLAGRYPGLSERDDLIGRALHGASFEELVEVVIGTEAAADRIIERSAEAFQARLWWDFERGSPPGHDRESTRLVFLHIMKTGGTSLSDFCSRWARPPGRARAHLYIDDLLFSPPAMLARLVFIAGHIPYEALELIPGSFRTAIVLREPVARAISHYLSLRGSGGPFEELTLDEFAANDTYQGAGGNYQARQLAHRIGIAEAWISYSPHQRLAALGGRAERHPVGALFDSTPLELDDDALLRTARQNLASIDFVGTTEDLDGIGARLADLYAQGAPAVPRLNVSPPLDRDQVSDSVVKRLEARSEVDRELYELARRADGGPTSCT